MQTILFIYLLFGLLINMVGPFKKYFREVNQMKYSTSPMWKKISIIFLMRSIFLIFNPLFYTIWLIDTIKNKKIAIQETSSYNENYLYFFRMAGAGTIYCKDCKFNKYVISFLHGSGVDAPTDSGYQCQTCGEFHVIKNDINNLKNLKCNCGGILDKKKPLFCPNCKSKNLNYEFNFIT